MADNKVLIELQLVQKGDSISIVQKQIDKTTKSTDKYSAAQDKLGGKIDTTNKKEKALYQSNLSSAKAFSKMNQTIGGSGGSGALVASYAVLAANVFAVTAAFNTLRQAAAVDKLTEGLQAFSNTTGQSLDIVAKRLQETTGFAVSFEQAMRTAALSTSAGFGVQEMEGLTRVAKGASLALGRDMGDALDRLTRGAIKLEPEILDELGIMVRLDDATEAYAAGLGKAASQLTRFERQQAFMNAIITEGESKFGAIADSLAPNEYDTLAAAFADLSKTVISFLNKALIPIINFMVKSPGIFIGAVGVFAGSITKRMLPAFGDLALASKKAAQAAIENIDEYVALGGAGAKAAREAIKPFKGAPKVFNDLIGPLKQGTATTKQLDSANRSLGSAIGRLTKGEKDLTKVKQGLNAADTKRLNLLLANQKAVQTLQQTQLSTAVQREAALAQASLVFAEKEIETIAIATRETFGFKDALTRVGDTTKGVIGAAKAYNLALKEQLASVGSANLATKAYNFSIRTLSVSFRTAGLAAKAFGAILLQSIPIIGQIILIGSLLIDGFKFLAKQVGFFSEESERAKSAQEDLNTVLKGINDKMATITEQQERANENSLLMVGRYKILGGLAKTIADETFRTTRALEEAKDFDPEKTFSSKNFLGGTVGFGAGTQELAVSRVAEESPAVKSLDEFTNKSKEVANAVNAALGKSFQQFILDSVNAGQNLGEIDKKARELLIGVEEKFNGVAQATEGMKTTLTESEKEAGKFVRTLTQTTKYDGLSQQFKALSNDLGSITREAAEAGADPLDFLADAVTGLGANMTKLIGPETVEQSRLLSEYGKELLDLRALALTQTGEERKATEQIIKNYEEVYKNQRRIVASKVKEELPAALELIESIREQSALLQGQIKFIEQRSKATLAVAKNEYTILAAKEADDAISTKQKKLAEDELKLLEGVLETIKEKQRTGKELSSDEEETLSRQAELQKQIDLLTNKIAGNSIVDAEAKVAKVKTMQQELKLQQEINTVTLSNLEKQLKLSNVRASGGQSLSGSQAAQLAINAAQKNFDLATQEADLKFKIIEAEFELLKARVVVEKQINDARIAEIGNVNDAESIALTRLNSALSESVKISERNLASQGDLYKQTLVGAALDAELALNDAFANLGNSFTSTGGGVGLANALAGAVGPSFAEQLLGTTRDKIADLKGVKDPTADQQEELSRLTTLERFLDSNVPTAAQKAASAISTIGQTIQQIFGEDGLVASSFAFLGATIAENFDSMTAGLEAFKDTSATSADDIKDRNESIADGLQGLANVVGAIGQLAAASGKQRVAAIDKEIEAEKKRDGKSKESLAKIAGLEKKKEQIERKNFERNKKIQMAQIVINTAAGIMKTIGETGFFGIPLALIIGAMGAAQLAMVAKTQFNGGSSEISQPRQSTIELGKRSNRVDVSKAASAGEASYLRGAMGMGSNANNFVGASMGRRGYADGGEGVVVGERGPEVIAPSNPIDVIPNYALGGQAQNITFNINAVDGQSVQNMLMDQQGTIIGVIRNAANSYGEDFLPEVNIGYDLGGG